MAQLQISQMPVVSQVNRKLEGFVQQSDLVKAYSQAVEKERDAEHEQEHTRLRDLTGQEIIEVKIRAGTFLSGKTLREGRLT